LRKQIGVGLAAMEEGDLVAAGQGGLREVPAHEAGAAEEE
jgi:hypothetical protein